MFWIGFDEETTIGFDYGRDATNFLEPAMCPNYTLASKTIS